MKHKTNNNGYTIIEVLVSLAILSIIIAGLITILMHQQRQFNLTSQGIDVNQTGRAALDIIAATIRNAGARQGKNVTLEFINGGSEFDPLCSDITSKTGQDSPPDCLTLYTWNITAGFQNDEIKSTAQAADAIIVNSDLSVNASNWLTPIADSDLIQSSDLIGFLSKTSLCNKSDQTICLNNPQDCTECGAILKIDSLDTSTKFANVSSADSILMQDFQHTDFSDIQSFYNNFFLPKFIGQSSEMTIVRATTFAVRDDDMALVMEENHSGTFQPIAGGEISGQQIGPGIVDLQFVFNLQDADGGITRVGKAPFDDSESVRQFADFTTVSSTGGLSYNADMRGREKDIRTVEIYLVVRSRLKPQLLSGSRIPAQTISAIGDVSQRETSHTSLGEGFIYKVFDTVVYLRNLGRQEIG